MSYWRTPKFIAQTTACQHNNNRAKCQRDGVYTRIAYNRYSLRGEWPIYLYRAFSTQRPQSRNLSKHWLSSEFRAVLVLVR